MNPSGFPASVEPAGATAGWARLLEALPQALWLVDEGLCIVGANAAAAALHGAAASELIGRPVLDFAVTPEDAAFWRDAAAGGGGTIESESLVRIADGSARPVMRRVRRMAGPSGAGAYLVALEGRNEQQNRERGLERSVAELQATLESLDDGILVIDLHGHVRHFNRRFAELWELPAEVRLRRAGDAALEWMRRVVVEPARYQRRLAAIDGATMLRATDIVTLRCGRVMERVTTPQCSRGAPIGRVFAFRELDRSVRKPDSLAVGRAGIEAAIPE